MRSLKLITKKIQKSIFIDHGSDYHKSIFLAGTGRSGTTWISDIINYENEYRYIFEPFYPDKVSLCKQFKYKQYLRPDNKDSSYLQAARSILTGKVRSYWTDAYNKKIFTDKRLIKDIRANFLIRWIFDNFPGMPIVFALRHPCAVANSRIQLNWKIHFEDFLFDEKLINDFLHPFMNHINQAKNSFERQIFLWCIENYVPLKQFRKDDIHLAFYENFCEYPQDEVKRLFAFLKKKYDDKLLFKFDIPSITSREDSAVNKRLSLINSWRDHITQEQIEKAVNILHLFKLDSIYSGESMPSQENAYAFMNKT